MESYKLCEQFGLLSGTKIIRRGSFEIIPTYAENLKKASLEKDPRGSQLIIHTASKKARNGKVNQIYTPDYI